MTNFELSIFDIFFRTDEIIQIDELIDNVTMFCYLYNRHNKPNYCSFIDGLHEICDNERIEDNLNDISI